MQPVETMVGLIGFDGEAFVVWGMGPTLTAARQDAMDWVAYAPGPVDLDCLVERVLTAYQCKLVAEGFERCSSLGLDLTDDEIVRARSSLKGAVDAT